MHVVDALAITGDEGRGSLRKAAGSWQTSIDPQISEWGNPAQAQSACSEDRSQKSEDRYEGVARERHATDLSSVLCSLSSAREHCVLAPPVREYIARQERTR